MTSVIIATILAAALSQVSGAASPAGSVADQVVAFQSKIDQKRFDLAGRTASELVTRYIELGRLLDASPDELGKVAPRPDSAAVASAKGDRKLIADALEKSIKSPRLPAEFQQKILVQMDVRTVDGDKLLKRVLDLEHIVDAPATLAAAVRALGTYRRAQHMEVFERLIKSDQRAEVMKASAWALGEYFGEKEPTRKRIVGNLIQAYAAVAPQSGGPGKPLRNADLSMEVRHDFQWALARLTGGVHFDRAKQWSEWWRDAKDTHLRDGVDRPDVKLDGLEGGPAPGSKPGGH